ncbi:MAG: hypothetical protein SGARI_004149 [Bacillariaceae sp.]
MYGVDLSCAAEDTLDESKCSGILYRFSSGQNQEATCPAGSEMIVTLRGASGSNIDYLFEPQTPGMVLLNDLPDGCVFVQGAYRCQSGLVTLHFSHVAAWCEATTTEEGCGKPRSGAVYGFCGEALECQDDAQIDTLEFETVVVPTRPPTPAPVATPAPISTEAPIATLAPVATVAPTPGLTEESPGQLETLAPSSTTTSLPTTSSSLPKRHSHVVELVSMVLVTVAMWYL